MRWDLSSLRPSAPRRRILAALLLPITSLWCLACDDGGRPRDALAGGGHASLPPAKFSYSPGPAGRAVGIRAVVEVDGVTLTSEPVEIMLASESTSKDEREGQAVPPSDGRLAQDLLSFPALRVASQNQGANFFPETTRSTVQASERCHVEGEVVSEIYTDSGSVPFISASFSVGQLVEEKALSLTYLFGRDGLYAMASSSESSYVPPGFQVGSGNGIGVLSADGAGYMTAEYLTSLSTLSVSFSVLMYSYGYTFFAKPEGGLARGIQYDTGISFSFAPFLPIGGSLLNLSLPIGLNIETSSRVLLPLRLVRQWRDSCAAGRDGRSAMAAARDNLEALASDSGRGESLEDSLMQELAAGALPLLESLSAGGVGRSDRNVPAGSNADMFAEFSSTSGEETREAMSNTSIDGQISTFVDVVGATDGSTAEVLRAAAVHRAHVERSVPSTIGLAALQREAAVGMEAGYELLRLFAKDGVRFVASSIKNLEFDAGEVVEIVITAKEIAELVGASESEVIGAVVSVAAGPLEEPTLFELEGEAVKFTFEPQKESTLLRIDVDLSTANGDFADSENWTVRPAMRLVTVRPGPAHVAVAYAARSVLSGAPVSVSVQVFDARGQRVRAPFQARLVDDLGQPLDQVRPEHGTALFQYVPLPSVPKVVETSPIVAGQGADLPGIQIQGSGFSVDAEVLVDGEALDAESVLVESPERIRAVLPGKGAAADLELVVRNPGGFTSTPQRVARGN